jgi:putative ABC transport system substrate-binding protein
MPSMSKRELLVASTASVAVVLNGSWEARAQQSAKPRVLGMLINGEPSPLVDSVRRQLVEDFAKLGYIEGKDLIVEPRFAYNQLDRFPELVAELLRLKVDVILAMGGVPAAAAAKVTNTTPIVYLVVTDPVALGLAASYERPGGNLTGVTTLDPQQPNKQIALLKEVLPRIERLAILSDPTLPGSDERGWAPLDRALVEAARAQDIQAQVLKVKGPNPDLESAFSAMVKERAEAVVIPETPVAGSHGKQIAELATAHRLLTVWVPRHAAAAGGVLGLGTRLNEAYQRMPLIVNKVLKGSNPGDLPVEVATRYELIVNLKAAHAIGVTIPTDVLKRADRVIE